MIEVKVDLPDLSELVKREVPEFVEAYRIAIGQLAAIMKADTLA